MSEEQRAPFGEIMQALHKLCGEGQTGTMYILTDQAHGAGFELLQGKIVDIFYRTAHGMPAALLMQRISTAKYFFERNSNTNKAAAHNTTLPANDEIFKQFGLNANARSSGLNGKAKKVLVVEDSGLARKAIVNVLEGKGYEIVEAKDGFEALGRLGEAIPDLVLLDLILPKMDGYAVLAAMKKDDAYKKIPVVVLTSRDALLDKLKGKMSGTDEYLTKPIKPNELLLKLEKYLD